MTSDLSWSFSNDWVVVSNIFCFHPETWGRFPFWLHPQKLTWNLEMMVSNRNLLFQRSIFRFHVNFWGCNIFQRGWFNHQPTDDNDDDDVFCRCFAWTCRCPGAIAAIFFLAKGRNARAHAVKAGKPSNVYRDQCRVYGIQSAYIHIIIFIYSYYIHLNSKLYWMFRTSAESPSHRFATNLCHWTTSLQERLDCYWLASEVLYAFWWFLIYKAHWWDKCFLI